MRIYKQAMETVERTNAKPGDLIMPFNYKKIVTGICPTLTTRPEGLKTMILIVERLNNESLTSGELLPALREKGDDI